VKTLRFHHELYSTRAIERSREVFAEHASIELSQELPYYRVELSTQQGDAEQEVAAEFANYVLALTAEERRSGETFEGVESSPDDGSAS
jgi:hypothetical protein